jgi:DNA-binding XRE family transcriptional regulator
MKNNIAKIREQRGLTQVQLAELVGVNKFHISNIERGKASPSVKLLIKIANVLNVSVDDLLMS